jgi:hypothetical protein
VVHVGQNGWTGVRDAKYVTPVRQFIRGEGRGEGEGVTDLAEVKLFQVGNKTPCTRCILKQWRESHGWLVWPAAGFVSTTESKTIYRVSQEECARIRDGVPYVKVYRYNPKHLCQKVNGYGDNGQRILKL